MDIEEMILQKQESYIDDCHTCPYKENCKNQCMNIDEHFNPNIPNLKQ